MACNFAALPTSIFETMSILARRHEAVNLGQGFPDFGWPEDVVARAAEGLLHGSNQYAPSRGLGALREAVADFYRRRQGLAVEADQVTVTSGATEAIASAILALVAPGDDVVLMQPLYDAYAPLVARAGGVARPMSLAPPAWRITAEALDHAFTPRTRLVVCNNPHNPTARLFDAEELALVAQRCIASDALVLADEVWEEVLFDGRRHVPLSALPGMAERVVKIGSAGKIFSLTGWKIGWAIAPLEVARTIANAHQYVTFASAPNLQAAVAYGLSKDEGYFTDMRTRFAAARDWLADALVQEGYEVLPTQGTYFLNIDLAASGVSADDMAFCTRAVEECEVAAIPLSPFYLADPERSIVRLCFAKQPETLERGVAGLAKARRLFA